MYNAVQHLSSSLYTIITFNYLIVCNACNNKLGSTATACMVQVRYESRRRLAETRPRVRGQFVKAGTAAAQSIAAQVCSIQPSHCYLANTYPSMQEE